MTRNAWEAGEAWKPWEPWKAWMPWEEDQEDKEGWEGQEQGLRKNQTFSRTGSWFRTGTEHQLPR